MSLKYAYDNNDEEPNDCSKYMKFAKGAKYKYAPMELESEFRHMHDACESHYKFETKKHYDSITKKEPITQENRDGIARKKLTCRKGLID